MLRPLFSLWPEFLGLCGLALVIYGYASITP